MKAAAKRIGVSLDEYISFTQAGFKHCRSCREWRSRCRFCVDASRGDGLSAVCMYCSRRDSTQPIRKDRQANRAIGIGWCRRCNEWKTCKSSQRDSICRQCVNVERRERYATNPEFRYRMMQHAYRRKRNVDAVPTTGQRFLLMLFDGKCAYCQTAEADSWDHMVPVSKGGRTTPGNIVPVCQSCNSSKKDSDLHTWLQSQGHEPSELLWDRIAFQEASLFG